MKEYIVENEDVAKRLDVFLQEKNEDRTRSYFKNLIENDKVKINGKAKKAGEKLKLNDKILVIEDAPATISTIAEDNIEFQIVFEDSDFLVINKPKGLVVHPCETCKSGTLVNGLLAKVKDLSGINGELRPGIVHRLDKDTSGLMVVAKNDFAHVRLAKQIEEKTCKRQYYALLEGVMKELEGVVETDIGRDKKDRSKMAVVADGQGKKAITLFKVLKIFKEYSLVEFSLKTGRTHQIRVHSKFLMHPVVGDEVYNNKKAKFKTSGQMLHAFRLAFNHPRTNEEIEFFAPLPTYFDEILKKLQE